MALDGGGGGGGGPVGFANSFTGPAEALELIGDHAYAYSGSQDIGGSATSANVTFLSFTTGNFYTFCKLTWTNTSVGGDTFYEEIQLNDTTIYRNDMDGGPDKQAGKYPLPLIISPYTEVKVLYGSGNAGSIPSTVMLTGRIYRTQ